MSPLEAIEQAKIQAEIAKLEAERAFLEARREDFEYESQEKAFAPVRRRILPFIGVVEESTVAMAMFSLSKMAARSRDPITIWFNSPGGFVVDGLALYDYIVGLRDGGIHITTVALGEAASMAAVLLQAGTERLVGRNAHVLIHEASGSAIGKTSELEDEVAYTKRLQRRLLGILAERSTLTEAQIARKWRKTDWWLDSSEATELGFADGVYRA